VLSIITAISLDHTGLLGGTLAAIAGEKAGIIKLGRPVVSAPQRPEAATVIAQVAAEQGSRLLLGGRDWRASGTTEAFEVDGPLGRLEGLRVALRGGHQVENAATAVVACETLGERGLPVPEEAIRAGLAEVVWPGRLELIHQWPAVLVDGAHNLDSAERLAGYLRDSASGTLTLILGIARDKDVEGMVAALAPLAGRLIATTSHHPRAADPARIVAAAESVGLPGLRVAEAPTVAQALRSALAEAGPDDLICVTGSLYAVAEAREALGLATSDDFERQLLYT
jgi:dihydrofolate synthase/folylpolyglutamate synthase